MKWSEIPGVGTYAVTNYDLGIVLIKVIEINKKKYWHYYNCWNVSEMTEFPPLKRDKPGQKVEPIVEMIIQ